MTRRTISLAALIVAIVVGAAAGCYPDYDGPLAGAGAPGATTPQAVADGGLAGAGLPCLVQAMLEGHCQSCHSQRPSAPMPLMTYADLMAKAPSDPKKRVVDVVAIRIDSMTAPMPPSGLLDPSDISAFQDWLKSGAKRSSCDAAPLWDSGIASGVECHVSGDCPGSLTCVKGRCTGDAPPSPPPAAPDTDGGGPVDTVTFADPRSASAWTAANLTSLTLASIYEGGTFDGRYVYYAPDGASASALRYDTTASYVDPAAWSTYSFATKNAAAVGYRGAAFDGRYVYYVPYTAAALLMRFDTRGSFPDDSMWTVLDLNTVGAKGFRGATFDGRYLNFVPSGTTALRYDTTSDLASAASWTSKDLTTVASGAYGFTGGVFDGRYMYYAPNAQGGVPDGIVARFDTQASFSSAASWSTFDVSKINAGAAGFHSAAFDGRYVYLVPGWSAPTPAWSRSMVTRYDTQGSFTQPGSWSTFDSSTLNMNATGYNSATFDGRYLVFAPGYDAVSAAYHGRVLAFDTTAPLGASTSWVLEDTTQFSQSNLRGAAFDGRYMYFAPRSGFALRLLRHSDSKRAPFPLLGGSFY